MTWLLQHDTARLELIYRSLIVCLGMLAVALSISLIALLPQLIGLNDGASLSLSQGFGGVLLFPACLLNLYEAFSLSNLFPRFVRLSLHFLLLGLCFFEGFLCLANFFFCGHELQLQLDMAELSASKVHLQVSVHLATLLCLFLVIGVEVVTVVHIGPGVTAEIAIEVVASVQHVANRVAIVEVVVAVVL